MIEKSVIRSATKKIVENTELIVKTGNALIEERTLPLPQEMVGNGLKESALMNKALTTDFNSPEELKSKKLLSAALLIAKKENLLPAGIPATFGSVESASFADEALTKLKAAYQVASGKMDIYEATDKMIDRATARLLAVSDIAVEKGVDYAINGLDIWAKACFPPAKPVVMIIKSVQPVLTQKLQHLVKKGIPKTSEFAKKSVRVVGEVIKGKVKSLSKNVFNLLTAR